MEPDLSYRGARVTSFSGGSQIEYRDYAVSCKGGVSETALEDRCSLKGNILSQVEDFVGPVSVPPRHAAPRGVVEGDLDSSVPSGLSAPGADLPWDAGIHEALARIKTIEGKWQALQESNSTPEARAPYEWSPRAVSKAPPRSPFEPRTRSAFDLAARGDHAKLGVGPSFTGAFKGSSPSRSELRGLAALPLSSSRRGQSASLLEEKVGTPESYREEHQTSVSRMKEEVDRSVSKVHEIAERFGLGGLQSGYLTPERRYNVAGLNSEARGERGVKLTMNADGSSDGGWSAL